MFKRNVAQSTNYSNSFLNDSVGSNLINTQHIIYNEKGLDLCEDENRCKILEKYILNCNNNHSRDHLVNNQILPASNVEVFKFNHCLDLVRYTANSSRNNYLETDESGIIESRFQSDDQLIKSDTDSEENKLSSILKYTLKRSQIEEDNTLSSSSTTIASISNDQLTSVSSTTLPLEDDNTLYDQLHGGKLDERIIELIICLRLYDIRQLTSGNTYTHYNSLFHRLAQDLGICPTDTRSIAELYRLLTYNVRKIRDKINKAICNSRNRFIRKIPVCFVKLPKFKFENPPRPTVFKKSMIKPNMLFKISSMHLCDNDVDLTTKFSAGKPILKVTSGLRQVTECISSSMQNIIKKTLVEDEELPSDLSIRVTVISDDDDDENVYIENKQKEFMDSLKKPDGSDNYDAKCPNCGYQGILTANHIIGPSCIKMAGILAASCIGLPFAWIPFTISRFKDSLYSCVNCKAILAISEKKFNKTKKLVWTFGLDEYLPTQYRDLNIRKKRPTFSSIGTEESFIDPTRSKSVKIVQLTNLM